MSIIQNVLDLAENKLHFRNQEKKLHKKIQKQIGFPTLHRAILSDHGFINDFTLEGKEADHFLNYLKPHSG